MPKLSTRLADFLWKLWYPFLTRLSTQSAVVFLNYGYAGDPSTETPPTLQAQDEPDRPCIQLYHRVATAIDLRGLDLLEVSCGHGGGASYVSRYLAPKSMRAIDRNARAIALCNRRHHVAGLTFSVGNALALDFPDASFDAVLNVEASHCYPDVPRFLAEVRRVLRPGGHFLYADFRDLPQPRAALADHLQSSGMEIISCEEITPNVLRGMDLNTEKYLALIRKLVPKPLQKPARDFAGVKGSTIYKALESGQTVYLCYHLRKRP